MWITTVIAEIERMEPDDGSSMQLEDLPDTEEAVGTVPQNLRKISAYLNHIHLAMNVKRKQRDEEDSKQVAIGYQNELNALDEIYEVIKRIWWKEIRNCCPGSLGYAQLVLRKGFVIAREKQKLK